ncbi:ABC transporter substrate-binding protein [Pseudarthrobacter sp. NPDC092184]|uniref:ABC transporter substrate-binding protein n=1 Tax=unclassified Pseudarthrobacter TaxID=2647000 RepID=UPI0032EC0CD4
MRTRVLAPMAAVALSGAMIFGAGAPASAAPPAPAPAASANTADAANVTSTVTGIATDGSAFAGTFTPTSFQVQDGVLTATGLVEGTLTSATGAATAIPATEVTTAVTSGVEKTLAGGAACDVVNLDLGPLNLNVLGLVIDLNQIQLDITAVPGAGNLVGNLLCAVTGLLDGSGTSGLANLLNRLLGL